MRSEGFPFIVGVLGVGVVFASLASFRRLSLSLVVCRRRRAIGIYVSGCGVEARFS